MNMFGANTEALDMIVKTITNPTEIVTESINNKIDELSKEFNCKREDIFFMFKANEKSFTCWIYRVIEEVPTCIKKIYIDDILVSE